MRPQMANGCWRPAIRSVWGVRRECRQFCRVRIQRRPGGARFHVQSDRSEQAMEVARARLSFQDLVSETGSSSTYEGEDVHALPKFARRRRAHGSAGGAG